MNPIPPNPLKRPSQAGSTIVAGLTIIVLATLGVTAWISLLSSRAVHIEGLEPSMKRRVATMNAGAVTREYLYRNVLTKATAAATSFSLPDGTATISVPALPEPALGSFTRPGGVVRTGPANGYGYYVELPVTTTIKIDHDNDSGTPTIDTTHQTDCLLKSRSPMLAGDLVTTCLPALTPTADMDLTGDLRVYGNVMMWASEGPNGANNEVLAASYSTYTASDPTNPDKIKGLDGNWGPQRNFASVPMTGGDFGTTNGYQGIINQIDPGPATTWSMKNKLLAGSYIYLDGLTDFDSGRGAKVESGVVDIVLDDIHLTNVLIGNEVDEINFHGQTNDSDFNDADFRGAITVMVVQTSNTSDLADVKFIGRNNRRLVFAVKKSGDWARVDYEFEDADTNPSWRLILALENVRFRRENNQPNGTVTMYGGIITDRDFSWRNDNNKILAIYREADPKLAERLAPRMAWIETYLH